MHSPGICGVILATGSQPESRGNADNAQPISKTDSVTQFIDALSADTEMVLVGAAPADVPGLEPVAWARAAYVLTLPQGASDADALRMMLQEVLNRGRDTALVAWLHSETTAQPLLQESVHSMVAAYCAAGDEVWALVPESETQQGHPMLMGRRMIELFLRERGWNVANEIISANQGHVFKMKASSPLPSSSV